MPLTTLVHISHASIEAHLVHLLKRAESYRILSQRYIDHEREAIFRYGAQATRSVQETRVVQVDCDQSALAP